MTNLLLFLGASLQKKRLTLGFARIEFKFDNCVLDTICFPAPEYDK
jgi:hypothetical protein